MSNEKVMYDIISKLGEEYPVKALVILPEPLRTRTLENILKEYAEEYEFFGKTEPKTLSELGIEESEFEEILADCVDDGNTEMVDLLTLTLTEQERIARLTGVLQKYIEGDYRSAAVLIVNIILRDYSQRQ